MSSTRSARTSSSNASPTRVNTLRDAEPDMIAVDGKTSRRSHARGQGREPLHMVSAWASRQRLVLCQEATDAKSNEITADAKAFAIAVRVHWHIENRLHWVAPDGSATMPQIQV